MITRVPAWSDMPSGNVTRSSFLASPSDDQHHDDHRRARFHVTIPANKANLLGICFWSLLADLGPERVGQLGLSALFWLRGGGNGSLRLSLGRCFRCVLLGSRMRCSNGQHRGKRISNDPRNKYGSIFHWTAPFIVTGDADADDTTY